MISRRRKRLWEERRGEVLHIHYYNTLPPSFFTYLPPIEKKLGKNFHVETLQLSASTSTHLPLKSPPHPTTTTKREIQIEIRDRTLRRLDTEIERERALSIERIPSTTFFTLALSFFSPWNNERLIDRCEPLPQKLLLFLWHRLKERNQSILSFFKREIFLRRTQKKTNN